MNRRNFLKNAAIVSGVGVLSNTALAAMEITLNSNSEANLFDKETKKLVMHLSDVIIPETEIKGAVSLNLHLKVEALINNIESKENKADIIQGLGLLINQHYIRSTHDAHYILTKLLDGKDPGTINSLVTQSKKDVKNKDLEKYVLYKAILTVRKYLLFAFYMSEYVNKDVLKKPVLPGQYRVA